MRTQPDALRPEEAAALLKRDDRSGRQWLTVAMVMVLLAVLPVLVYAVTGKGHWDHIAGRSEPVTAQVESVRIEGRCRTGVDNYQAELTWTINGVSGHRTYSYCNDPELGDTVQVWVGPSGHAEIDSPTEFRLALGLMGIGLSVLSAVLAAAFMIITRRRRRRALAVSAGDLSPPVPVELRLGYKARLRMHPMASISELSVDGARVAPILYTRDGHRPATRTLKKVTGTWWLRHASTSDDRRRIGLLERDQERFWIEFSARRR